MNSFIQQGFIAHIKSDSNASFLLLFGVSQPLATYNLCFVEKSSLDSKIALFFVLWKHYI